MKNFINQLHQQENELDSEEMNVRKLKECRIQKDKEIAKRWEIVQKEQIKLKELETTFESGKVDQLSVVKPEEYKFVWDPE